MILSLVVSVILISRLVGSGGWDLQVFSHRDMGIFQDVTTWTMERGISTLRGFTTLISLHNKKHEQSFLVWDFIFFIQITYSKNNKWPYKWNRFNTTVGQKSNFPWDRVNSPPVVSGHTWKTSLSFSSHSMLADMRATDQAINQVHRITEHGTIHLPHLACYYIHHEHLTCIISTGYLYTAQQLSLTYHTMSPFSSVKPAPASMLVPSLRWPTK